MQERLVWGLNSFLQIAGTNDLSRPRHSNEKYKTQGTKKSSLENLNLLICRSKTKIRFILHFLK